MPQHPQLLDGLIPSGHYRTPIAIQMKGCTLPGVDGPARILLSLQGGYELEIPATLGPYARLGDRTRAYVRGLGRAGISNVLSIQPIERSSGSAGARIVLLPSRHTGSGGPDPYHGENGLVGQSEARGLPTPLL
jgi:hypothetical protein